jgi:predicted O-methyltransferase YrrM
MLPANYTTIHGWCTIEKANKLMELVKICKPKLSVELGVFGGRSLLPIALMSKKMNRRSRVIGIDAWSVNASLEGTNAKENDEWWANINYTDMFNYTKSVMIENNVNDIVELWKESSKNTAIKFEDKSIDLLHQDSNHSEEVTCVEVELYWNKVNDGGYWIFDDTNWPTTQKAQDLLLSKGYTEYYNHNDEWKVYLKNKAV